MANKAGHRRFGAIRRLASGRWQARYTAPTGEVISAPSTFGRKSDASRWLAQLEVDVGRGAWVDERRGRVLLGEWGDRWLLAIDHLKPSTRVGYESLHRSVIKPALGGWALADLRRSDIQLWVSGLVGGGMSPSRARQAYRLVSQLMKSAQMDGVIAASPCIDIRLPRLADHEPKVLTVAEVVAVADAMRPLDRLFVLTSAFTGMRFGEVAGLRRRYVLPESRLLVVASSLSYTNGHLEMVEPKSHQHRMVTLPEFLCDELAERLDARTRWDSPDDLVFTSPGGLPIRHPNFLRRVWQPACQVVGVTATPHDLRASHATWLYDAGWSPIEIAARLGHSSASVTTKHYARRVVGRDVQIATGLHSEFQRVSSGANGTLMAHGTRASDLPVDIERPKGL